MAKRRTLRRHWLEEKERADKLEKEVKLLERLRLHVPTINIEPHPVVSLECYMDVDAREYSSYEMQVKNRVVQGMFGLDDDDNPLAGLRCIRFTAEPAPYPRHYLGTAEEFVRVTAECQLLNLNDENTINQF